jgi:hypothetical protein
MWLVESTREPSVHVKPLFAFPALSGPTSDLDYQSTSLGAEVK